ncbi:lipopolysaccharide biosynthesis protein [Cellulomonas chitinilytica]|uniref:Lipopolysaccharide biosynthesis protein n=1 Tax=Cellulomonas chitinilytica TaxID=398759 RepID=A0A919U138_9CELL|nr:lipopolysaccharide biosynthesis protein [Cellulomonas chitinilytica]GIG22673.1 lipopolysaccharide biosynthesis protein [Cellulomonas chitinilytica]
MTTSDEGTDPRTRTPADDEQISSSTTPPATTATTTTPALAGVAARGAAVTMGSQVAGATIRFASLVVLARMLTPHDYGLVAMVAALIGIGDLFRDFGLGNAAIQAQQLSRPQRDNLFWINTGLGLLVGAVIAACAQPIARFYDEPAVAPVVVALSATLLLSGLSTQHRASLMRAMRFTRVAAIDLVALGLGLAAAVVAALAGLGYWALVIQELVRASVACLGVTASARWWPGLPRRGAQMRGLVSYGANLLGTYLVAYASRNVDSVVIGARFGPTATGLYNRAFGLMSLPMMQINAPATRVALPVLSRLVPDRAKYRRYLLAGQTILLHITVPVFVLGIVLAEPLVRLALGETWMGAVPILRVLAIGGLFDIVAFPTGWVFQSSGATRSQLRFVLSTRPLIIVAVLVGSHWGVIGVAAGYAAATTVVWPTGLLWVTRAVGAPGRALFANGLRAVAGYVVCGALAWVVVEQVPSSALVTIPTALVTFAAVAAVLALVWRPFGRDLRLMLSSRTLLARRGEVAVDRPATAGTAGGAR